LSVAGLGLQHFPALLDEFEGALYGRGGHGNGGEAARQGSWENGKELAPEGN